MLLSCFDPSILSPCDSHRLHAPCGPPSRSAACPAFDLWGRRAWDLNQRCYYGGGPVAPASSATLFSSDLYRSSAGVAVSAV